MFGRFGGNIFGPELGGGLCRFKQTYRCYSVTMLDNREDVERGGKIIMPPSALDQLTRSRIQYPMQFKLRNNQQARHTHCGVLEFVADEGRIYIPNWMMRNLLLNEGDLVEVENVSLKVATFTKFQPQSVDFLDIRYPEAVLGNMLRSFACLTKGDVISIKYNERIVELSENTAKKLPRDIKANFTSIEANLISSRITNELELLKGGFSTEVTNQRKNALGVCFRTEAEVRNNYRNMCRGSKEKFTYSIKEMDRKGGRPPPTQFSIADENIVNAMKDSASFSGVSGIETDITCNEANPVTNGSQSPCTATPRPTTEESVWIRALDRHHSNLQNNQQTFPVADDPERTDRNAACPGPSSSASFQSQTKRSSSSCSIQPTPTKKKKDEDFYSFQRAVLEKELEKNILELDLLNKLLCKYDNLDSDALELLSVLGQ